MVDLTIDSMVIFHSCVNVYQRVYHILMLRVLGMGLGTARVQSTALRGVCHGCEVACYGLQWCTVPLPSGND